MNRIAEAYQIEQSYLMDTDQNKMSLIDRLNRIGYMTLEDYFSDKREYLISLENIQIEHYSVDEVKSRMDYAIEHSESRAFAIDDDCTWAWIGSEQFDFEKAEQLNVKPCVLGYRGGTIITCNSDFNVAINFRREIMIDGNYYLNKMNSFLRSRGFDTRIDGNDIMTGEYKIAGSSFYGTDKSGIFFMSLALTDNTYLIEQLCVKERKKIPSFLAGITKSEIEEEVNGWLKPNI